MVEVIRTACLVIGRREAFQMYLITNT